MIRNLRLLPDDLPVERIASCIALISDTHQHPGIEVLPDSLLDALRGVDLVLHAGDVGDHAVLNRLSEVASVIAVGGNDDSAESDRKLPYTQVVTVRGQRILLWHSHYLDVEEEYAARVEDAWEPKFQYRADFGRQFGAGIVVYGHTHIPTARWHDGVLLVNPGAAGFGTSIDRTVNRSAALLFLRDDGQPFVTHFCIEAPNERLEPSHDEAEGFRAAWEHYNTRVIDRVLGSGITAMRPAVFRALRPVRDSLLRLTLPRWLDHTLPPLSAADFLAHVCTDPAIPADVRDDLRARLEAHLEQVGAS